MANIQSAIKRVRQDRRRRRINAPRRSAAKTSVAKALALATGSAEGDAGVALASAMSMLDRAAKSGAIHPNAAARRKSRLALKVNAALGGLALEPTARPRGTGKAAAVKAARARVAAAKARTETGPRTAAGKARVALAKTTTRTAEGAAEKPVKAAAPKAAAQKAGARKTGARKAVAEKAVSARTASTRTTGKTKGPSPE